MNREPATIKAAAAQLRAAKLENPAEALAHIHGAIEQAAEQGVELLVLPECAYPAYALGSAAAYRAARVMDNAALVADLSSRAKRHTMHLVCGFVEERGAALANAAMVIDHRGKVLGIYRKTFLWGDGNDVFTPGDEVVPIKTRWGKIGIAICADARAPETIAALAAQGARLICVPTCWVNLAKTPGEFYNPQPDFLIEARAREFALPFVCANKVGEETPALNYCGFSLIVDHTGGKLAEAPPDETMILCAEVVTNKPTTSRLSAEVRERLETEDPPVLPDPGGLNKITVAAVPTGALLPLAEDAEGHDLLETLASDGASVVATTVPDKETSERLGMYARAIGLRLVGYALRERVVFDTFGSYACVSGAQMMSYATARVRALNGAAILFVTDMPADLALLRTRAAENRVYVVGTAESAAVIIGPDGAILAACASNDPQPVTAALDLRQAADKLVFPRTDIWVQRRVHACRAAFGRRHGAAGQPVSR